ncbi:tetratricopeptide repeat protein [candidate division KSB1 bacterium]|nr:tetratricopeptide repeat protein [candidate division KSB1 bacterium]
MRTRQCVKRKLNKISFILLLLLITLITQPDYINAQEQLFADNLGDLFLMRSGEFKAKIKEAEALIENGNQFQAIAEYEKIVEEYPDHVSSWKRLAQLYNRNDKPEKSVTCYEKIVEANPLDSQAMKILAQNYIRNDRQKDAINLLEKVVVLEPDSLRIHKKLARLYSGNNMPKKLINQYEKIVQLDSTDTQTMKKLAANYSWDKKPLLAIKILEAFINNHPDSLHIRRELAEQYEWNDMSKNAIIQYEEIIKRDFNDIKLMKKLAQQYMWNNRSADAVPLLRKILFSEPENIDCKIQLANAYVCSNQAERAERPLLEILQKQPYNKEVMLSLAERQQESGKWDLAKQKLKKLLRLDPNNEKARELLTGIRRQYGTFPEARYYRISDSNKLTREQLPLTAACFFNRQWEYVFSAAHYRVLDGRLDSTLAGYGAKVAAKYNYSPNTSSVVEFAVANYSTNWTPLSFQIQFNQRFFDKIYTNVRYFRTETREGVRALTGKILLDGYRGELYCQVTKRWSLSGDYTFQTYSDKNRKIIANARSNFLIKLNNPKLYIFGCHSFIDFKNIYSGSLPYWTPEALSTSSLGLNFDLNFSSWLNLGGGYSLANQRTINSHNFNGQMGININRYGKFFFQYVKNGSKIYNTENYLAYFQYRF